MYLTLIFLPHNLGLWKLLFVVASSIRLQKFPAGEHFTNDMSGESNSTPLIPRHLNKSNIRNYNFISQLSHFTNLANQPLFKKKKLF
jgi:hypothetical protein